MSEVVALLLDDAMPPERLGELLRAARKRRGLKRKHAAKAAGTTAASLRAYEHGLETVPADVCARLAECYGEDLTAHVPLRVPPKVDGRNLAIAGREVPIGPDDAVIAGYVEIIHRLRDAKAGEPLALRSADVVALAAALGRDAEVIEQQIVDVLGCTPAEAHRLHGEMLRRKVILPVAGLAAGMAALAGAAYATHSPSSPSSGTSIDTRPIVASAPATAPTTAPAAIVEVHVTTPTTAPAPVPTTTTTPATTPPTTAPPHHTDATASHSVTDATVPAAQQPADTGVSSTPPQADPNDPPVSILPGETPITIIGSPDSAPPAP